MRASRRSFFLPLALPVGAGLVLGLASPSLAVQMQPLSDAFIHLLGWLTCPLIFCMLAVSVAALAQDRELGRIGTYAMTYFALMSVLAMLVGLALGWALEPGVGASMGSGTGAAGPSGGTAYAGVFSWIERLPSLQANNVFLLAAAVPVGIILGRFPKPGPLAFAENCRARLFDAVKLVLWLAPVAGFGAMASAVGRHGLVALWPLLKFIVAINFASIVFVLVVIGSAARLVKLPMLRFLAHVRGVLYLVFFTGSSLAGLAPLSEKLEELGCPRAVTGVVLPFSYSLNLAGTYLYIALALVFLMQAAHVQPGWRESLFMLGVALVSSKGAVAVAGSGVATLAATVALLGVVPPEMVTILLAIDRTMKCRLLTNVIGHGVACVVVAVWEGSLDRLALRNRISHK